MSVSNEEQLKLVICTPQAQKPPILEAFLQSLKEKSALIRVDAEKYSDVFQQVSDEDGALIMISVQIKEELPEIINLLAKLKTRLNNGTHKIIIYNELNNEKVISLLHSKGASEILDSKISIKAFQYKFNKITQLLHQSIHRAKERANSKQTVGKTAKTVSGGGNKKTIGQVVFVDPIEHESDFWLLMNPKNVRYVIGKWFTNFYGPGPSVGLWESYPETRNGEQGWIWNPRKDGNLNFFNGSGRWVFFGNCPEFSWEEKHWYFISKTPEFSFYEDKKIKHTKIRILENSDIEFCQNSNAAKKAQPAILESIEASIRLNESTKVKKSQANIAQDKEKKSKDYREEKAVEKEYCGRFSEQFEEKKKKQIKSYECSELSLGLISKNGALMDPVRNIKVIELREKYVVLDVPAGLLVVDDQAQLEAYIVENGIEKKVPITTAIQIVETETEEEDSESKTPHELRSVVICEMNEAIASQFIELIRSFKTRREEMGKFFTKAKGVA